jgi:molecular chaperone GrpE
MKHREDSEFDPSEGLGGPDSEDAFARGAGSAAEDDFESGESDLGVPAASAQVTDLERQLAEQQDKYLRLAAEYDNYRKRTARERGEIVARSQADLAKHLLDALDDLARFAHVDPASVDPATIVQGVDMVEKKFLKTLTTAGLEIIDPVNQSFDPQLHEAVATEPALSPEDDHVVSRVYQAGYRFSGQLLRPARVVVKQWNG